jgi:predicted amidophosphoribosyltransferase
MRLFRRKATVEDEPARCPVCRERLPDGADECAMCGADLKPLRPWFARRVGEPVERDQRTTGPRPIA